jgi:hypothetical protein
MGTGIVALSTWVTQIFADVSTILGLSAQITNEGRTLQLTFWREDISREFARDNALV